MAGTPSELSDHISIEQPDVELNTLGGDDTVLVVASGAKVSGGAGDDWLSTSIHGILDEEGEDTDGDGEPDVT